MQARKTESKLLREAHQRCVQLIETDNDIELEKYLKNNLDLPIIEIIDSNGRTLLHESTFADGGKCTEALLGLAKT